MNWELILKYVNTEANAEEERQVEQWLDEQSENAALLAYLQKRKNQLHQPLKQTDIDEQWLLLLSRIFDSGETTKAKGRNMYISIGIAASILLVSMLGWIYLKQSPDLNVKELSLPTAANNRNKVILPDGTEVFMAPASKIIYKSNYGIHKRELQLNGEAFFNVKHKADVPFIIHTANKVTVTVLGTSFNVYNRLNANTEVKVATGLVGVTANNHTSLLKAGQQGTYTASTRQIAIKQVETHDAAALQNGILFFKEDNADEIAQKIERWYNIKVTVSASARKHARFSGEIKDDGIDSLLHAINYAVGLKYQFKDSHTLILF